MSLVPEASARRIVFTIGHSNHAIERFLDLLRQHSIEAIADVRSHPRSRFNPQFSLKRLRESLESVGVAYLFLGRELGARSDDPALVVDGKVDYGRLANTPSFAEGVSRVVDVAAHARVALLCAERDPLECHRAILVCPAIGARGLETAHIREDGRVETRGELETRLLVAAGVDRASGSGELFPESRAECDDRVALAYRRRGRQIAYAVPASR
jgi:uncharacterized protein (DUF488 family)